MIFVKQCKALLLLVASIPWFVSSQDDGGFSIGGTITSPLNGTNPDGGTPSDPGGEGPSINGTMPGDGDGGPSTMPVDQELSTNGTNPDGVNSKDVAKCAEKNGQGCEACAGTALSNRQYCLYFADMETPECAPVSVGDMGTGYDMCAINEPGTVVDVAAGTGTFETLLAAASVAGLVEFLSDPQETLTVFAPVDAAFEGLDVEALLADPDGLRVILLNHVLSTKVMSTDLSDGQQVTMLGGSVVTVMIDGDKVMINNAVVTSVDVMASNGVIHILDAVLNFSVPPVMAPTNETMAPTPLMINVTNPVSGGPNVTAIPTPSSSAYPSVSPSTLPTATPSASPSTLLTTTPSASPSTLPTATPSATPSTKPTASPTVGPTEAPVTNSPTISPSSSTSIPTRPLNVGPDDSGSKVVGIKGGLMLSLIVSLFL